MCGCAGKTEIPWEHVPYLSASAVVIHYEEATIITIIITTSITNARIIIIINVTVNVCFDIRQY